MVASPVLLRDVAQAGKEFSRANGVLISQTSASWGGEQPLSRILMSKGLFVLFCFFPQE